MSKALVVTSVASMVDQFLIPSIVLLQDMGYTVEVACNFEKGSSCAEEKIQILKEKLIALEVKYYQVDFSRSIFNVSKHIRAYKQIKRMALNGEYSLVHCHSPIGGIITRLACRKLRKKGTKVFYTAHGFHFYKGAPLKNWLIYYPVEKICSRYTDVLITINQEDYAFAKKKMKAQHIKYVPGVGADVQKFGKTTVDKASKRKELGIPENATLLFSVGELNKNKNHETVIRAIADMDIYYVIAGKGDLQKHLQTVIDKLGMTERVKFLGFRNDIAELCTASDVFVFPSFREGLSMALMEAMASGLPCAVSKIRGNTDLIDENGGVLFNPHSVEECKDAILTLLQSDLAKKGEYNIAKIRAYDVSTVNENLKSIYEI